MRIAIKLALGCVALIFALGCGGGETKLNTAPWTDEQKAQIKAQDQKVDEEENAANTKRRKKN